MPNPLHWWFDFSCPYAYLSSTLVEDLAARTGAELIPEPMLLGGVFQARGVPAVLASTFSAAKAQHMAQDVARIAARHGVPIRWPAGHPMRTVLALRTMLAAGQPFLPLARRFFAAYWAQERDISSEDVVASILREAGHDAEAVLRRAGSEEIKDELRLRTDRAIAAGVFGAPSFEVDGVLEWGQDRMDRVERALGGHPAAVPPAASWPHPSAPVELWFDFSSPFAYLGFSQAERMFGPALRLRPMLLGALFREVGQVEVPLFAMHESRRQWIGRDIHQQAEEAGVPFRFSSHFPVSSLLPLRVLLLLGPDSPPGRRFAADIYRGIWAEDRDPRDPVWIGAVLDAIGADRQGTLDAATAPPVKEALRQATLAARDLGLFGAPSWVIRTPGAEPTVLWGNDRIEYAALVARGLLGRESPGSPLA